MKALLEGSSSSGKIFQCSEKLLDLNVYQITWTSLFSRSRKTGQSNTGSPAKDVVLTTPCDSSPDFERDLVAAARAAGFNVLRLVKEPVAAVMAYGLGNMCWMKGVIPEVGRFCKLLHWRIYVSSLLLLRIYEQILSDSRWDVGAVNRFQLEE